MKVAVIITVTLCIVVVVLASTVVSSFIVIFNCLPEVYEYVSSDEEAILCMFVNKHSFFFSFFSLFFYNLASGNVQMIKTVRQPKYVIMCCFMIYV